MRRVFVIRRHEAAGRDAGVVLDRVRVTHVGVGPRAVPQAERPRQPGRGQCGAGARRAPSPRTRSCRRPPRWSRRDGVSMVAIGHAADGDRRGGRARQAAGIGDAQTHGDRARARVRARRRDLRRIVVGAVAVEIPRVRERLLLRVARIARVERDGQRRGARGRVRRDPRRRRRVVGRDPADGAARQVGVVERAVGALREEHRAGRAGQERPAGARIREAVRALGHHPDAVARVVAEEQRVLVVGPERVSGVEREAGDRRGARRAALAGDDLVVVVVGEVRRGHGAGTGAVERLAAARGSASRRTPSAARPRSTASRSCGPGLRPASG